MGATACILGVRGDLARAQARMIDDSRASLLSLERRPIKAIYIKALIANQSYGGNRSGPDTWGSET